MPGSRNDAAEELKPLRTTLRLGRNLLAHLFILYRVYSWFTKSSSLGFAECLAIAGAVIASDWYHFILSSIAMWTSGSSASGTPAEFVLVEILLVVLYLLDTVMYMASHAGSCNIHHGAMRSGRGGDSCGTNLLSLGASAMSL
jgi:hypothetical protein